MAYYTATMQQLTNAASPGSSRHKTVLKCCSMQSHLEQFVLQRLAPAHMDHDLSHQLIHQLAGHRKLVHAFLLLLALGILQRTGKPVDGLAWQAQAAQA